MVPSLCKLKALLENTVLMSKSNITNLMYLYLNPLEIGIKKKFSFDFFLSSHCHPGLILSGYLKGYQAQVAYN